MSESVVSSNAPISTSVNAAHRLPNREVAVRDRLLEGIPKIVSLSTGRVEGNSPLSNFDLPGNHEVNWTGPHGGSLYTRCEMSTPQPTPRPNESLEVPVEELLRRGRPHPAYGEHVIEDLTSEEADAFLEAVLS